MFQRPHFIAVIVGALLLFHPPQPHTYTQRKGDLFQAKSFSLSLMKLTWYRFSLKIYSSSLLHIGWGHSIGPFMECFHGTCTPTVALWAFHDSALPGYSVFSYYLCTVPFLLCAQALSMLWVKRFLHYCENIFIHLLYLIDSLPRYRILDWKLLSLRMLKVLLYSVLAFRLAIKVYFYSYSKIFIFEFSLHSGSFDNPFFVLLSAKSSQWYTLGMGLFHSFCCAGHSINS